MDKTTAKELEFPIMSEAAFALLGVEELAYIREVTIDGRKAWAIHAADGQTLGAVENRDLAFAAAIQNDRIPLSVH